MIGDVTSEVAIKGFAGAVLLSAKPASTAELMEDILGFERVGEEGDFVRFTSYADIGNTIDIKLTTNGGSQMGVGTIHHIAFRAKDDKDQLDWRGYIANHGYAVTL